MCGCIKRHYQQQRGLELTYKICAIAASDPSGIIGDKGHLPWDCEEDRSFFAQTVAGSPLIVGRKTFETLPDRYKQQHELIVFSQDKKQREGHWVSSLEEFDQIPLQGKVFLIGGGMLYRLFFSQGRVGSCYLTIMKSCYTGDTTFPLEALQGWKRSIIKDCNEFSIHFYENYAYTNA